MNTIAEELEAELRRLGWWDAAEPRREAFESRAAFFADTMSFAQWLRYVLLARLRAGVFPKASDVAAYAVRELDGQPDADRLIELLCKLDAGAGAV